MAAEGTVSHQITGSPSEACGTLIEATMNPDVIKTTALVAGFMVAGIGGRKWYSTISTSPVAFNSFHDSKFMRVKG